MLIVNNGPEPGWLCKGSTNCLILLLNPIISEIFKLKQKIALLRFVWGGKKIYAKKYFKK